MTKQVTNGMALRIVEAVVGVILAAAVVKLWETHDANLTATTELKTRTAALEKQMDFVYAYGLGLDRDKKP